MRRSAALSFAFLFGLFGCGRTGVWGLLPEDEAGGEAGSGGGAGTGGGGGKPSADACRVDADCVVADPCTLALCVPEGGRRLCRVEAVTCDDGNPCTLDRCEPTSGSCTNEAPADRDRDGFVGAAPAGAPTACGGNDCDDTDPAVHPGAADRCNGKDDDCDGSVDSSSSLFAEGQPRRLTSEMERTQHGGIAWDGSAYGITYGHTSDSFRKQSFFARYDAFGVRLGAPVPVSEINADTFQGSLAWSGQSFLTAWSDARQAGNYEVYTTRFDREGRELSADQRLTDAPDFSVRPNVRFDGSDYVVVWDDHRFEDLGGTIAVYARRLSAGGTPLGEEVRLSPDGVNAQYAALAVGKEELGVAYVVRGATDFSEVRFSLVSPTLDAISTPLSLDGDGQEPSVAYANGRYVVAWHSGSEARNWGPSIHAALIDTDGRVIATRAVTTGDAHAKWRTLVALGDRVVLIWAAADEAGTFALYFEQLSTTDLSEITPRHPLARSEFANGDLIDPIATLGPNGDIAVLYDDNRAGIYRSYFTRITCIDFEIR